MVSMWFKHETSLIMMIDFLKMMEEELDKAGQPVSARLGVSPQRKLWAKAQAMFFKRLKEVGGNEATVNAVDGNHEVSLLAEVGPQGQSSLQPNTRAIACRRARTSPNLASTSRTHLQSRPTWLRQPPPSKNTYPDKNKFIEFAHNQEETKNFSVGFATMT